MIRLLASLLLILFISFLFVIITNKKIGKMIPLTYIFLTAAMWVCSFFEQLSLFKYTLIIGIVILFIISSYLLLSKKRNIKNVIDNFIRPSLLIYIFIYLALYNLVLNIGINNIDDYYFWGLKLKDMQINDVLYSNTIEQVIGNTTYPPFPFLMEMSFIKLFGQFNPSIAIFALSTFTISFFIPLFDDMGKNIIKIIVGIIAVVCTILVVQVNPSMINDSLIINSLYVDWILSILLAYGFYCIYDFNQSDTFDSINIGVIASTLIMFKQIGLALALLLAVTLFIYLFIRDKKINNKALIVIILPLLVYAIWKVQLSNYVGNYSTVSGITNGLQGVGEANSDELGYYTTVINSFLKAYFNEPIIYRPIKLSYFILTIMITLVLFLLGIKNNDKKYYYSISLMYFLGSLGYALGILLSYMFLFPEYEAVIVALFGRYMQTYTYFGIALVVMILFRTRKKIYGLAICVLVLMIFIEPKSIDILIHGNGNDSIKVMEPNIQQYFTEEYNDEPMIVINQNNLLYRFMIYYNAYDNNQYITYHQVKGENALENFISLLEKNNLVYIGDYDDEFNNVWKQISDTEPYNHTLYRVVNDDSKNGFEFEMIYCWDSNEQ